MLMNYSVFKVRNSVEILTLNHLIHSQKREIRVLPVNLL